MPGSPRSARARRRRSCCPRSTFTLRAAPAPVAALRDAGAALAIATDLNPGTSPVCSMPETIAFACSLYGMTPLEALTAATANPAWVLGLDDRLGTLEPGKRADLVLLDGPSFAHVPYRPGHDPVVGHGDRRRAGGPERASRAVRSRSPAARHERAGREPGRPRPRCRDRTRGPPRRTGPPLASACLHGERSRGPGSSGARRSSACAAPSASSATTVSAFATTSLACRAAVIPIET